MNDQLQPLKKPTRATKRTGTQDDIVYAHIFDAILEQRLAPGTKLSEEALGEIFGVSRTIIRRALSRLAHEGVVLLRPNRGAVVASPSVDERGRSSLPAAWSKRPSPNSPCSTPPPSNWPSCGRWSRTSEIASTW